MGLGVVSSNHNCPSVDVGSEAVQGPETFKAVVRCAPASVGLTPDVCAGTVDWGSVSTCSGTARNEVTALAGASETMEQHITVPLRDTCLVLKLAYTASPTRNRAANLASGALN